MPEDMFEKYDNTDLCGPGAEMGIQNLIMDCHALIQDQIPEEDRFEMRKAIQKLWIEKIQEWDV